MFIKHKRRKVWSVFWFWFLYQNRDILLLYFRLCFQMVATGNGDFLEYYIYLTRGWGPNMVRTIYRRTNKPAGNFKMEMRTKCLSNRGFCGEAIVANHKGRLNVRCALFFGLLFRISNHYSRGFVPSNVNFFGNYQNSSRHHDLIPSPGTYHCPPRRWGQGHHHRLQTENTLWTAWVGRDF